MESMEFKDDLHDRELEMRDYFHARRLSRSEAQIVEYRTRQAEALAKERESTLGLQKHCPPCQLSRLPDDQGAVPVAFGGGPGGGGGPHVLGAFGGHGGRGCVGPVL